MNNFENRTCTVENRYELVLSMNVNWRDERVNIKGDEKTYVIHSVQIHPHINYQGERLFL